MIVDALPAGCHVTLVCEVDDAGEERAVGERQPDQALWLHRGPAHAAPGALLLQTAGELPIGEDAQWWVACEA